MIEYTYKYQKYLRNQSPQMGPLYTSFIVTLEMHMESIISTDTVYYPTDKIAEIG